MTHRFMVTGALAVLVIAGLAAVSSPISAAGGVTLGGLAVQMARAVGMNLPSQGAEQAAAQAFKKAGIDLGGDLTAAVTEKTLVQVGKMLGASVTSSRPTAAVSPAVGQAFVQAIKGPLQAAVTTASGTQMPHVSCQGRESRQDRKGTPASPANINAVAGPC